MWTLNWISLGSPEFFTCEPPSPSAPGPGGQKIPQWPGPARPQPEQGSGVQRGGHCPLPEKREVWRLVASHLPLLARTKHRTPGRRAWEGRKQRCSLLRRHLQDACCDSSPSREADQACSLDVTGGPLAGPNSSLKSLTIPTIESFNQPHLKQLYLS